MERVRCKQKKNKNKTGSKEFESYGSGLNVVQATLGHELLMAILFVVNLNLAGESLS